jgi:hypothetical protein
MPRNCYLELMLGRCHLTIERASSVRACCMPVSKILALISGRVRVDFAEGGDG